MDKSGKFKEGKGNVLVSVRVRPDAGGSDSKADGEWMVDGRRCLVSYRGKEGGDYFYGKHALILWRLISANHFFQCR
jgi:centromeric protein E